MLTARFLPAALLAVGLVASPLSWAQPINTTNIGPELYVPKVRSRNGQPPLAHCRQINQEVNGHMVSRRQCITPASIPPDRERS
ncbi:MULTISPECIES: hypothetical protein [Burkholderiaceae]|uniref:hypothetical protein n=1 Tax=Burkholderiaceae TaxID=119060 RepID=UPI0002A2BFCC|nr:MULTISPECIES: hypothetical protein [Burkholderiaceae]ELA00834.1 hypothetical protein D769_03450 [Cupriavidus sp. HMR-1]KVS16468.1 hypothetical protein WK32_27275 [Burkholderia vietnamiensis]MDR8057658.1 hypothetical protein [Burkholderia cenocepacia]MDR8062250.1 hypothetical protein [Burkholderia cenocepacia]